MVALQRRKRPLLLLVLALVLVIPSIAQAKLIFCRSDPVVVLSNGTVLDLSADVSTLLFNVREVHYELHIPAGVKPILVIHTPAWLTSQETFSFIADQQPGHYTATALARTHTGGSTVTEHLTLLTLLNVKLDYARASGPENVPIYVAVEHGTGTLLSGLFG
jgi:hypothetical protein